MKTISDKLEVEDGDLSSSKKADFTKVSAQLDNALSKIKKNLTEEDYKKLFNGGFSFNEVYMKFLPKNEAENLEEKEVEEAREREN